MTGQATIPTAEQAVAQARAYADQFIADVLPMESYNWTSAEAFARYEAAWKSLRIWKSGEREITATIRGALHSSLCATVLDHVEMPEEWIMGGKSWIEDAGRNGSKLVWLAE